MYYTTWLNKIINKLLIIYKVDIEEVKDSFLILHFEDGFNIYLDRDILSNMYKDYNKFNENACIASSIEMLKHVIDKEYLRRIYR